MNLTRTQVLPRTDPESKKYALCKDPNWRWLDEVLTAVLCRV